MILIKKNLLKLSILIILIYAIICVKLYVREETKLKEDAYKARILRYECEKPLCGGWADRLKGIMSAYYWALFTGRKFELNMKHPCNLENILLPNKIDWKMTKKSPYHRIYELSKIDDFNFREISMKELNIIDYKSKYQVIVIKNNLDWLLSMSKNPYLQKKFSEFGFRADEFNAPYLFYQFYNNLFKLNPYLHLKHNNFKSSIGNRTLICAQFRVYYALRENSLRFWQFINTTLIPLTRDYRIFLTTDDDSVYDEAFKYFDQSKFVSNPGITYHMDTGKITPNDCSRIEKTILDFHSLQLCDMAVISDSGYGKLGVYNRLEPEKSLYIFKNISGEFVFKKMSMIDLVSYDPKF